VTNSLRRSIAVLIFAALAAGASPALADAPGPLTLCLAAAADDSPVYPLKAVPANNREIVVVFRLRDDEAFGALTHTWTVVDVGAALPAGTVIASGSVPARDLKHGVLRMKVGKDLAVGTYHLDVAAEKKPWASLDIRVVAATPVTSLAKPEDLLPLVPGTAWTYSFVLETGPAAKNKKFTVAGVDRGADGVFRGAETLKVAAKDGYGARIEFRRGETLLDEEWWALGPAGLAIARMRLGTEEAAFDPPVPMLVLPLASPAAWTHKAKDGSFEYDYRMWGPLAVAARGGETPGWVVWLKQTAGNQATTIERQFAPGVGLVREVKVVALGTALFYRQELVLQAPK